jgi:hypothetical protein
VFGDRDGDYRCHDYLTLTDITEIPVRLDADGRYVFVFVVCRPSRHDGGDGWSQPSY